jgi:dTDP-4-amino-4,6-dideoxygalactose transaminase
MQNIIPLSTPVYEGRENDNVLHALRLKQISTAGSFIEDFEDEIENRLGPSMFL